MVAATVEREAGRKLTGAAYAYRRLPARLPPGERADGLTVVGGLNAGRSRC